MAKHAAAALPPETDPVTIAQEVGWASVSVWIGAKNSAPTGNRSSDTLAIPTALSRPTQTEIYYTKGQIARNIKTCVCVTIVAVEKHYCFSTKIVRGYLSLIAAVKLSPAGRLGGFSQFVLQTFQISTNKPCNCTF